MAFSTQLASWAKWSDLKLICENQEFMVHKVSVCPKSPVLTAACEGSFLESVTNTIHIKQFDAPTVMRMLEFMYNGSYTVIASKEGEDHEGYGANQVLAAHVLVNLIADYYDVPPLRELATSNIATILRKEWSADQFCSAIENAMTTTSDRALRNLFCSTAAQHQQELLERDEFADLNVPNNFYVTIMKSSEWDWKARVAEMENDLEATRASFKATRRSLKDLKAEKEISDGVISTQVANLLNTERCRNCRAAFTCYFDREAGVRGLGLLRCKSCLCRH